MLHRRHFLFAAPLAALGCRKPSGPPAVDTSEAAFDTAARLKHLADTPRTPSNATFKTAPPPVDVAAQFPELKPLTKVAVRLHPRLGDEPPPESSHFGGRFLWAKADPWPTCPEFKIPMAPVFQLRRDDAPPQLTFRPGTEVLQVFWTPRPPTASRFHCVVAWAKSNDVGPDLAPPPDESGWLLRYAPAACRVFTERVAELPDWATLQRTGLKEKLGTWMPPGGGNAAKYWDANLSAAAGSKAGGWPVPESPPACKTCNWGMDYLLTVADAEWPDAGGRWKVGDAGRKDLNLTLPGGRVQIYVCRRCDHWPVAAVAG